MILTRNLAAFVVDQELSIETALRHISANQSGTVIVVESSGRLIGAITDGDFRRWLVNTPGADLNAACFDVVNPNCIWVREDADPVSVDELFGPGRRIIPVVDDRQRVTAIAQPRKKGFSIAGRSISPVDPAFVIGEIGNNHNGSLARAKELIDAVAAAGADCAKFQLRDMKSLYRESAGGEGGEDIGVQYTLDLLARMSLTADEMIEALEYTRSIGLVPLCTPWDTQSAQLLADWGVPAFKIASADLTNHELIRFLGDTARPLIMSTGMSTEAEIVEAIGVLRRLPSPYALLHANSSYPAAFKDVNLLYLDHLAKIGNCLVGYSGHERGYAIVLAAVARGAKIIEKHISLDRTSEGNDHRVSLEPPEFAAMVAGIREIEEAFGTDQPRRPSQGELLNRLSLAKSLVATSDLSAGHVVTSDDVAVRSPGRGLQPNSKSRLIGTKLRREFKTGDFFFEADLAEGESGPRDFTFSRPWGIPVRYHDYQEYLGRISPDFLEFHMSYRDLDVPIRQAIPESLDLDLVVHSPDVFSGDLLLDLAADDDSIRSRSIAELQRVVNVARELAERFTRCERPLVIVSVGGASIDQPLAASEKPRLYERAAAALQRVDADGVELIAQTLPPFPWHFGGQRHWSLFVDPEETAQFSREHGIRLCLDISHTKLACNHARSSFSEAIEILAPLSAHLHIVDATGADGEGVQIGEGDIDWPLLGSQLRRLAPDASFIPEVWQGHVGGGEGFWTALDRLEGYLSADASAVSANDRPH